MKKNEDDKIVEIAMEILVEVFGSEGSKMAKPLFLKNRTLTITCLNSAIAQDIRTNQQTIVDKINLKLAKKEVDRIRYLT